MGCTALTEAEIRGLLEAPPGGSFEETVGTDNPYPDGLLPGAPRLAAVLVLFVCIEGEWHILFTRRTETLVEHSGQVAFPGGRMDPDDRTPENTALREAFEEIGLEPETVRLLGRLDPFVTITNYLITPVVGVAEWPFQVRIAGDEVSRVFTIPLNWLANPQNYEVRQRILPEPYQPVSVIYFAKYDGEVLWGVSARITYNLLLRLVWDRR